MNENSPNHQIKITVNILLNQTTYYIVMNFTMRVHRNTPVELKCIYINMSNAECFR